MVNLDRQAGASWREGESHDHHRAMGPETCQERRVLHQSIALTEREVYRVLYHEMAALTFTWRLPQMPGGFDVGVPAERDGTLVGWPS